MTTPGSFHEVVLPEQFEYGSSGGPGFNTAIVKLADSKQEQRISRSSQPEHAYELANAINTRDEIATLRDFYMSRSGATHGFRFKDPLDYSSAANGRDAPTTVDQTLGTGDGSETLYQLVKVYQDDIYTAMTRTIEKPIEDTVIAQVNGVIKTEGVDFTVNTTTGIVTFTVAPPLGHVVKAGFEFHVPVRFGADLDSQFEQSYDDVDEASIGSAPLVEISASAAITSDFFFGGSNVIASLGANTSVTLAQGLLVVVEATTASGWKVILEDPDTLPTGALIMLVVNQGDDSLEVRDDADVLLSTVASAGGAVELGIYESGGSNNWVVVNEY